MASSRSMAHEIKPTDSISGSKFDLAIGGSPISILLSPATTATTSSIRRSMSSFGSSSKSSPSDSTTQKKPDSGSKVDLRGSPVSTLLSTPATTASTTSSSSSSSCESTHSTAQKKLDPGERGGATKSPPIHQSSKPGQSSSKSHPSTGSDQTKTSPSGSSSSSSSAPIISPCGNIFPSGKIPNPITLPITRSTVLGFGVAHGYGTIMPGGEHSSNPEEVRIAGNMAYKKGNFADAFRIYGKAIGMSPKNATYRSNRAAALSGLGRLCEAVKDCEDALRLDPTHDRAHPHLGRLFLRLGHVESARKHLCEPGIGQPDPVDLFKLETVEKHISKCVEFRKKGDWLSVLMEVDAAINAGADSSAHLCMCRAEALLKLHQIDDVEACLLRIPKWEPRTLSLSRAMIFGMRSEAYCYLVSAEFEMACGRFEYALKAAEKAEMTDSESAEIADLLKTAQIVARARVSGNDLFKSERFTEAATAYGQALKLDPSNYVLYYSRAACWFKIGQWEKSVEDSTRALHIQPQCIKALRRRAASYSKLERWAEAVKDYEVLQGLLPDDNEVAEALFHAHIALKSSLEEDIHNLKFGGEVEAITSIEQYGTAIAVPGISVVYFKVASESPGKEISACVDTLCIRYPTVSFHEVDIQEHPTIAIGENVRVIPTLKIYRKGRQLKELVRPSCDVLENSIKHYISRNS